MPKNFVISLCLVPKFLLTQGRALARVVSLRSFNAEARVYALFNPCGIYGGQSVTEIGFSPSSLVFSCQYHSTAALHTHISSGDVQQACL
jgi:hypothetical protein